jgi:hypothetical protein
VGQRLDRPPHGGGDGVERRRLLVPLDHIHQRAADRHREAEDEQKRADRPRLLPQHCPDQRENRRVPRQFQHAQEAQQTQHAQIAGAQQAEHGRQDRDEIHEREKAQGVAKPAGEGPPKPAAMQIDRRPYAQRIFDGENRRCDMFERNENEGVAGADRLYRFKDHRADIDDDEQSQRAVEILRDPVLLRVIVEQENQTSAQRVAPARAVAARRQITPPSRRARWRADRGRRPL